MNAINEDDIFEAWLETSTVRTDKVILFADQAGIKELQELYAQEDELIADIDQADEEPTTHQRAVGEKSALAAPKKKLAALREQITVLEARVQASRSVWTMRALREEEVEEIKAEFPQPQLPTPTQEMLTTTKGKQRWAKICERFEKERSAAKDNQILHEIARSCVLVETEHGDLKGVSVERLGKMLAAEYGATRIALLSEAKNKATHGEKELPRPLSPSSSANETA